MELLAEKITDRLKDHKSCTIFENDLERVWPVIGKARQLRDQRITLIKTFAKAHGWSAVIHDPGIRVTFRPLRPGEHDHDSAELAEAS